jgi:hypothetical protein
MTLRGLILQNYLLTKLNRFPMTRYSRYQVASSCKELQGIPVEGADHELQVE